MYVLENDRFPRAARAVLATLALAAAGRAAADVRISWDPDLAFEWDRANYEQTLRGMVRQSEAEVSSWLGFPLTRELEVRVMTKTRYEGGFGSEMAWNTGAHYVNGVVNVNGGARFNGYFTGLLTHELTHAFLDDLRTGHRFPSWFNEGLAERLGYRTRGQEDLTTSQITELKVALGEHRLVPLSQAAGRFRYLQGFAAVLFLERKVGKEGLLAVVRRTMRQGTFEQALDAELRLTPKDVDERFATWVDHL